jgi:hypothetical protein
MPLDKFVEEIIQKAIAKGEFDNLEGKGKPVDLTAYFNTPAEFRVGYSLLKSNKFVPEEVELLKEIGFLKEKIKVCEDAVFKQKLTEQLNEKTLALSIIIERNKRRR